MVDESVSSMEKSSKTRLSLRRIAVVWFSYCLCGLAGGLLLGIGAYALFKSYSSFHLADWALIVCFLMLHGLFLGLGLGVYRLSKKWIVLVASVAYGVFVLAESIGWILDSSARYQVMWLVVVITVLTTSVVVFLWIEKRNRQRDKTVPLP